MPTVRDLTYLNRDFRRLLETGLSNRPGSTDLYLWPLLYLGTKLLRHSEALELLASREYGSEAGILLRSMFEATVNLLWISKDPRVRLTRYMAYLFFDSQKYRDASKEWNAMGSLPEITKKQIEEHFAQLSAEAKKAQDEYGFKSNENWAGKSLKAMAKEVGWSERYDFVYKIYSDVAHSNILASDSFISVNGSGRVRLNSTFQIEHCKTCLCEAYVYLWTAFSFLDIFLDLGMTSMLEKAYLRIPKT